MSRVDTAILDIGSSKITVLIGRRGVNNTFVMRGRGECEYDGYGEGAFYNPELLREVFSNAIRHAETNAKANIEKLYVGIPGEFCNCFVKDTAIALRYRHRITDSDVTDLFRQGSFSFAKEFGSSKIIAVAPIHFTTDDNRRISEPIGITSTRLAGRISYIFSDLVFLQTLSNTLKDLGVSEIEFLPAPLSCFLYLFSQERRDAGIVLLDFGHIAADVVLGRGDGIEGLKTLAVGGGHITAALYTHFEPPEYAIAEQLKRKVVLSLECTDTDCYEVVYKAQTYTFSAPQANEIVRECVKGFAEMIKSELDSFEGLIGDNTAFYLTGGGLSHIRGAKEILSHALGKRVELAKPIVPLLDKPDLSSTLGLLDHAIEKNTSIPPSLLERLKTQWNILVRGRDRGHRSE